MTNEDFIRRTFDLARKGAGATWPNPLVGAVIVKDGRVIGEGHHHRHGHDHAELDALKNATESPEGATLYVNLEPCCHTNKKTPPCAQRLITEKIKKVVISNLDPNPLVNGKGVELLRASGIEVKHGVLEEEGEVLNEVFFLAQRQQRPFIHLKMASTLDGKTALPSGESKWITGEEARREVHHLRSLHQGIVVGAETVRKDNPKLNVRIPQYEERLPYRIVFTESGLLPAEAQLFNDELKAKTLIYTKSPLNFSFPQDQVVRISSLKEAMDDLFRRKLINLFLEGGSKLAASFMRERLVDRVSVFLNPSFLGQGTPVLGDLGVTELAHRPRLKDVRTQQVGEDIYLTGRLS